MRSFPLCCLLIKLGQLKNIFDHLCSLIISLKAGQKVKARLKIGEKNFSYFCLETLVKKKRNYENNPNCVKQVQCKRGSLKVRPGEAKN